MRKKFNQIIEKFKNYSVANLLKEFVDIMMTKKSNKNNDLTCKKCNREYTSYLGLKKHVLKNDCTRVQLDIYDRLLKKHNIINNMTEMIVDNINNISETIANNIIDNVTENVTDNIINNIDNEIDNEIDDVVDIMEKKGEKIKYKKKTIPLALKKVVWDFWVSKNNGTTMCLCCQITEISQMSFHCGHIISEYNGGELRPSNLMPICQACNSSMGTMNMDEFIETYYLWETIDIKVIKDYIRKFNNITYENVINNTDGGIKIMELLKKCVHSKNNEV